MTDSSDSYLVRIHGDPEQLVAGDILEVITNHYAVEATLEDRPGFYPADFPNDPGRWVVHVKGGSAFAFNAVAALSCAAAERAPGPSRSVFERICDGFIDASPNHGE